MAEPGKGLVAGLWRVVWAVLAVVLVLNFAVGVLRCVWPWIVGVVVFGAVVVGTVWWVRTSRGSW